LFAQTCFWGKGFGRGNDADVSVVRIFRKHVGDRLVGLLHEIVDNHQRRFFTVKVFDIRKTLIKFCAGILVKELLVCSVEVNSLCGWRRYQRRCIVDQSKHETSLSAARGAGHDRSKRMDERQHNFATRSPSPREAYGDASCEPNLQSPLVRPWLPD